MRQSFNQDMVPRVVSTDATAELMQIIDQLKMQPYINVQNGLNHEVSTNMVTVDAQAVLLKYWLDHLNCVMKHP